MDKLKKLINYNYDCVREILKSSSFLKLKPEQIYKLSENDYISVNDKNFNKILTEYKKNKSVYNLLIGKDFIKTESGIYTPLIYADIEFIQNDDKYIINVLNDYELNINLLVNILDDSESGFIIETLLKVNENEKKADVLKSFIDVEILSESAVILAKLPEATAGILNELKKISVKYCRF